MKFLVIIICQFLRMPISDLIAHKPKYFCRVLLDFGSSTRIYIEPYFPCLPWQLRSYLSLPPFCLHSKAIMATTAGIEPIADPRPHHVNDHLDPDAELIHQRTWGLTARVDPSVTFEEYVYWAKIERAEEHEANRIYVEERGPLSVAKVLKNRFSKGIHHDNAKKEKQSQMVLHGNNLSSSDEKVSNEKDSNLITTSARPGAVSPEEWKTAARALKTASWGTIFFLITTDILGWSTTP